MSRSNETKNLIVGLDIGTSKIVAIVAEVKPEGGYEVIGMGSHPSRGAEKRRGRQYRNDRECDPAGAGRGGTDG